jgi:hypothetical protein
MWNLQTLFSERRISDARIDKKHHIKGIHPRGNHDKPCYSGYSGRNFHSKLQAVECASMLTTLKYLMDGEDFHILENGTFFAVNIPKGTAMDVPELAYSFPESNKNRYRINVINNARRNRYRITVFCGFDSDGDGRDDRFIATTNIVNGQVRKNRLIVKTR